MVRQPAGRRSEYQWFLGVTLRWNDIDVFGHVNNARYYEFFDTAVVGFLHALPHAQVPGDGLSMVVAESGCRFLREIKFSDRLEMGLRVERVGTSSVRYGLAAFVNGEDEASADGHFVHVFLDQNSKRPTEITQDLRRHFQAIAVTNEVST